MPRRKTNYDHAEEPSSRIPGKARTAVIEGRVDYETMASLHRYFTEMGYRPMSKSDLIWKTAEALLSILEHNGKATRFASITEAYAYMQGVGMEDLWAGGSGRKAFARQMQVEALVEDGFDPGYATEQRKRATPVGVDVAEVVRKTRMLLEAQGVALPRPEPGKVYYVDEVSGESVEWKDKPAPDLSVPPTPVPSVDA